MSMIARGTAIRFTPLDTDGNPAGEATIDAGGDIEITYEPDGTDTAQHAAEETCQFSTSWPPIEITLHLNTQPFLKEWRKTMRNLARVMNVPPYVVMKHPSCPRPSPAARGYQKRIRARRRRNRK